MTLVVHAAALNVDISVTAVYARRSIDTVAQSLIHAGVLGLLNLLEHEILHQIDGASSLKSELRIFSHGRVTIHRIVIEPVLSLRNREIDSVASLLSVAIDDVVGTSHASNGGRHFGEQGIKGTCSELSHIPVITVKDLAILGSVVNFIRGHSLFIDYIKH